MRLIPFALTLLLLTIAPLAAAGPTDSCRVWVDGAPWADEADVAVGGAEYRLRIEDANYVIAGRHVRLPTETSRTITVERVSVGTGWGDLVSQPRCVPP